MKHFTSHKKEISGFLTNFLMEKKQVFKNSYFSKDVFERLVPLTTSGKMLRGSLLINTYRQLAEQEFSDEVLRAAVALELAQTGFLIHDDIIDQDELRRGQVTLHRQYAQKFQQSNHVGASLAICVGDITFFLACELLSGDLVKLFSRQLGLTAFGEMHDVELALMSGEDVTKENILQMYLDKTSSYSVCLPLMAGAVLAKKNQELVAQLNELGKTIGLIFQIEDDRLGLFGDEQKTGKPVGADARESKKTLYYYYLMQEVDNKDDLLKLFAENEVEGILDLMKTHQIEKLVGDDLKELENRAQQQIDGLLTSTSMKEMMSQFLDRITNRIR